MASVFREFEIELEDGRLLNVGVTVEADHEANYGADYDGNRGVSEWFISDHSWECDEELSESEKSEVDKQVEDLVNEESWDFDTAQHEEEMDEGSEDFF